jgi:hypothetical protein
MRALLIVGVVAACGSSTNNKPDAPSSRDASADAPTFAKNGAVSITQGFDGSSNRGQASATFVMGDLMSPVVGTDGPCTAFTNGQPATLDAGTISVSGTLSAFTLTASGSPLGYSASGQLPYPLFSAGAAISFTAAGGAGVPAFNGTVTAPADIAGFVRATSLSRSGYTVAWTAGAGPNLWVLLVGADASFNSTPVICKVSDTGSFVIPASTFALLSAADTMGGVAVLRFGSTVVDVADTQVGIHVATTDGTTLIPLTQ